MSDSLAETLGDCAVRWKVCVVHTGWDEKKDARRECERCRSIWFVDASGGTAWAYFPNVEKSTGRRGRKIARLGRIIVRVGVTASELSTGSG